MRLSDYERDMLVDHMDHCSYRIYCDTVFTANNYSIDKCVLYSVE